MASRRMGAVHVHMWAVRSDQDPFGGVEGEPEAPPVNTKCKRERDGEGIIHHRAEFGQPSVTDWEKMVVVLSAQPQVAALKRGMSPSTVGAGDDTLRCADEARRWLALCWPAGRRV